MFSGQATTVKHAWAWLVLGLVTAWEHHELLAFKAEGSKKDRKWRRCKGRSDNRPNAAAGVAEWLKWPGIESRWERDFPHPS